MIHKDLVLLTSFEKELITPQRPSDREFGLRDVSTAMSQVSSPVVLRINYTHTANDALNLHRCIMQPVLYQLHTCFYYSVPFYLSAIALLLPRRIFSCANSCVRRTSATVAVKAVDADDDALRRKRHQRARDAR
jgi:hypothetical protein